MPQITVTEVVRALADELGEAYHDPDVQNVLLRWIGEAVEDMYYRTKDSIFVQGQQPLTTVANVATYDLASNTSGIQSIYDKTNNRPLRYRDRYELERSGVDLSQTGEPQVYFDRGFVNNRYQIQFWPIPSSAKEYTVVRTLDPPTQACDDIDLPRRFHRPLRFYVKARYYENMERTDLMDRLETKYLTALNQAIAETRHQKDRHVRLRTSDIPGDVGGFEAPPGLPGNYPGNF